MYGAMFNYEYLKSAVSYLLGIFTKIWEVLCSPFIDDFYLTSGGGRYDPTWSYLLPIIIIFSGFIAVALVKKIIFMFVERSSAYV